VKWGINVPGLIKLLKFSLVGCGYIRMLYLAENVQVVLIDPWV
jgi:hypothetical protein